MLYSVLIYFSDIGYVILECLKKLLVIEIHVLLQSFGNP
jgi:hypothetical protein